MSNNRCGEHTVLGVSVPLLVSGLFAALPYIVVHEPPDVIPAPVPAQAEKSGNPEAYRHRERIGDWIPAFAGMTRSDAVCS